MTRPQPRSLSPQHWLNDWPRFAAGVLLAALLLAGCAAPTSTATPAPEIPPTTVPAATLAPTEPPAPTVEPTALVTPLDDSPYYLPDTRTGIAVVDSVIEAFLAGDRQALIGLVHYTVTACTHADGLGGPPKCAADQAEGTEVEIFPVLGSEGTYLTRAMIDDAFPAGAYALHSVYRVAAEADEYPYWPAGEYGVTFIETETSVGLTILVAEAGIVRNVYTFPGQNLPSRDVGEYLLKPVSATGASFSVPEAKVAVSFSRPGRFVQSQEANRRGSFVSYDFQPENSEPPYLQEIQFFSEESIGDFNAACQGSEVPCFFGDYPDLDRYYREKVSYMAGADVDGSDRLTLGGRAYYVTNRPCEGDTCIIREYTTFVGGVKVDVWVLMGAEAQAESADKLVQAIILNES